MGRTVGPVGDDRRQRSVVEAALALLVDADRPEALVDYDPSDGVNA